MNINGLEGLTDEQLSDELQRGARFVLYQYCVSVILMTFKRPSDIYYLRPAENGVTKGLGYTVLTMLLGWWGVPWGPIFTVQTLWINFRGGKDVTSEVLASIRPTPTQRRA